MVSTQATVESIPPLINAANRLELLLVAESSLTDAQHLSHSSPSKLVKRWLGASSGIASAKKITLDQVAQAANVLLNPGGPCATGRDLLLRYLPFPSDMDIENVTEDSTKKTYLKTAEREVEAWLITLAVRYLITSSKVGRFEDAVHLSESGVKLLTTHLNEHDDMNHPTKQSLSSLYPFLARMIRYRQWASEAAIAARISINIEDKRADWANVYRTSVLRQDVDTQASIMNCMLRNLLDVHQGKMNRARKDSSFFLRDILKHPIPIINHVVEQAHKLLTNSTFPTHASNNQLCRHLYYSGRIHAIRLDYTTAYSNLSTCLRKVPTNNSTSLALGFRIAVQRLLIVVQLLMGEIPDRNVFYTSGMKGELEPYLKITQAVRRGDLAVFRETVGLFADRLRADGCLTLISRLAHSVVKAGLRRLYVSYSRISLEDIAQRLGLQNVASAEFVVSKAVKDGVIDATIFKDANGVGGGYVQSHELVDVYATTEPSEAYHRRIAFCLTSYNDAMKGMRFRPDDYKKQLEASRGLRGKKDDDKTDEEKAKEMEDEMDGDY